MEADFKAEPRAELTPRALARDGFFKGAAELNFCVRIDQEG
jgi:hypothetical protein